MRKHLINLFYCFIALGCIPSALAQARTGILVLGSADLATLHERINIAYKLYAELIPDYMIVSGGCGAHQSSICEADLMFDSLVHKGVPAQVIIKEGNAKTTVQNYLYAKQLNDAYGRPIIQKADLLYVVSNHWHAISVANRFVLDDQVNARYHIQGNLQPKATDLVDYVGILYETSDGDAFRSKGMWPSPDAVVSLNGKDYYLLQKQWFSNPISTSLKKEAPAWLQQLDLNTAGAITQDEQHVYLIQQNKMYTYSLNNGQLRSTKSLPEAIQDYPERWLYKHVDAACVINNQLFLFQEGKLLIAQRKGNTFIKQAVLPIAQHISDWPFAWGAGWITAASYNLKDKTITLYRNRELLKLDQHWKILESPKRLALDWTDFKQQLNIK